MNQSAHQAALVLSGGGAYGAFGVGVMKVLFAGRSPATSYQPLNATIFSGTSVGAFNAATMVGCRHLTELEAALRLEEIWVEHIAGGPGKCGNGVFRFRGNPADYFNPSCYGSPGKLVSRFTEDSLAVGQYLVGRTANFLASSAALLDRGTAAVNLSSFIDPGPFYEMVRETIHEEDIRLSPRRLSLAATNWTTGEEELFKNADFVANRGLLAVMASTAIPGVFPPVQIGDCVYADGGIVANTPLTPAIHDGATDLHVIYLNPEPQFIPLRGEPSSIASMLRVYYMMLSTKIDLDIAAARRINDGLKALDEYETTGQTHGALAFVGISAEAFRQSYSALTIHRYYPQSSLGGDFGMLDFQLDAIFRMIEEGEKVALSHDCDASRCLV